MNKIDTMRRHVVIAELVGGEHDGRRIITQWDGATRSIFVPVIDDNTIDSWRIADSEGMIQPPEMSVLEYKVGTRWCVYTITIEHDHIVGLMRDTLYNDRWQTTKYHLVKETT